MPPPIFEQLEEKFLQKLPSCVLERTIGLKQNEKDEETFLRSRLPPGDVGEIERTINKRYNFTSVRAVYKQRTKRKGCPRKKGLSSTKKRLLGLNNIPRKGLSFNEVLPLHNCWKEYIMNAVDMPYLKKHGWEGNVSSSMHEELSQVLWKADYHGAYITVTKATSPSLVGIEGIVVFETKNQLKVLGKDNIVRTVPKEPCEFKVMVGNYEVIFLGKHFMTRPTDRAVKKIKAGNFLSL